VETRSSVFKSSPEQSLQAYSSAPASLYPTIAELGQVACVASACERARPCARLGSPVDPTLVLSKTSPPTITGIRLSCLRSSRCWIWRCCQQRLGISSSTTTPLRLRFTYRLATNRSFANPAGQQSPTLILQTSHLQTRSAPLLQQRALLRPA